jgi:hypothetical protein
LKNRFRFLQFSGGHSQNRALWWISGGILACACAFNAAAFFVDARRPHFALRKSAGFPSEVFQIPSLDNLRSPSPDPSPKSPSSNRSAFTGTKDEGSSRFNAPKTSHQDREQQLLSCALLIQSGKDGGEGLIIDSAARAAILSAYEKIKTYRSLYPSGPMPSYLETELDNPLLTGTLDQVSKLHLDPFSDATRLSPRETVPANRVTPASPLESQTGAQEMSSPSFSSGRATNFNAPSETGSLPPAPETSGTEGSATPTPGF